MEASLDGSGSLLETQAAKMKRTRLKLERNARQFEASNRVVKYCRPTNSGSVRGYNPALRASSSENRLGLALVVNTKAVSHG